MRRGLIILMALSLILTATPAFAQSGAYEEGTLSLGLGYGFGDDVEVAPIVFSGKYWNAEWELGGDVYFSSEDSSEFDQLGMLWLAYRYEFSVEEDSATYGGIGGAGIFEDFGGFQNQFGPIAMFGWDSDDYGVEFKYAWFDPSIISIVGYYHFSD